MTLWGWGLLGGVVAGGLSAAASGGSLPDDWRRAGEDPGARAALSRALDVERFRGGFGDMVPLANALLEASLAVSGEPAASFAVLAAEAAPEDPRPRARLVSLALRGRRPLGNLVSDLWRLIVSLVADPWIQLNATLRLTLVLWAGSALTAIALGLAAACSRGALLLHDYSDAFPPRIRRFSPAALAVLTVAALWGGGVGLGLLGAALALALSGYLRPSGRWALGVSLCLSCLLFPGLAGSSRSAGPAGERAWALYRVAKGAAGSSLEKALGEEGRGRDPEVCEARSVLARRAGRYAEAIAWLEAALAAGAKESEARLEIGNLFFLEGRFGEAVAQYGRAAAADATDPRPWVNLHVAHLKRLALAEADQALEKALSLDASSPSRFRPGAGTEGGAVLLPVTRLPEVVLVHRAFWDPSARVAATWPDDLWQAVALPIPWLPPALLGAAALLVAWALGTRGAQRLSRRCPSCGASVCPRCSRRVKGSDSCPPCWAVLTQKGGDAAERARQQQLMATWKVREALWRRVASVLLPGWSDFAAEGSPRFLAVGLLWSLAAGALVTRFFYPAPLLPWSGPGLPWLAALLLAGAHVQGLLRALDRRPPPGRG